jgi:hypothetical protein
MRRETIAAAEASDFRGDFYGIRVVPTLSVDAPTVRVDNGLREEIASPRFLPTLSGSGTPARRVVVVGPALVELAESVQEALFLASTPAAQPDATAVALEVQKWTLGAKANTAQDGGNNWYRFLRPKWARSLALHFVRRGPSGNAPLFNCTGYQFQAKRLLSDGSVVATVTGEDNAAVNGVTGELVRLLARGLPDQTDVELRAVIVAGAGAFPAGLDTGYSVDVYGRWT